MANGACRQIFRQALSPFAALLICVISLGELSLADSMPAPKGDSLTCRYAGGYDTDGLMNEPAISDELQQRLGTELEHFRTNLEVRGSVDLLAGSLVVTGNAIHGGGNEEAVLCVSTHGMQVSAAIFSNGLITIFSKDPDYDAQSLCIKDWITQVNSGHRDRLKAASNVRISSQN